VEQRKAELRAERDKWAEQTQRLALAPPAGPNGLWKRLFG
jgi:hypothetical protein